MHDIMLVGYYLSNMILMTDPELMLNSLTPSDDSNVIVDTFFTIDEFLT